MNDLTTTIHDSWDNCRGFDIQSLITRFRSKHCTIDVCLERDGLSIVMRIRVYCLVTCESACFCAKEDSNVIVRTLLRGFGAHKPFPEWHFDTIRFAKILLNVHLPGGDSWMICRLFGPQRADDDGIETKSFRDVNILVGGRSVARSPNLDNGSCCDDGSFNEMDDHPFIRFSRFDAVRQEASGSRTITANQLRPLIT